MGLILSVVGAVAKIELPVIPGLVTLSIFGIGLFLMITGISTFARAVFDVLGPFWTVVITVLGVLTIDWVLRTFLKVDLFAELLKLLKINWPSPPPSGG